MSMRTKISGDCPNPYRPRVCWPGKDTGAVSTSRGTPLVLAGAWQSKQFLCQTGAGDKAWHAPDNAGCFILGEDLSALRADALTPAQAILSHTGQDDGQHAGAVDVRR